MPAPRYPAVVFDLDGTLIDTVGLIVASHRHAVTTVLGHDLPDDVLAAGIGTPLMEQMRVFDDACAGELFDAYRTWNHANTERLLRRFDGVDGVLVALAAAGVRLAVATSKMRDAVDLAFGFQPPPVTFDVIVTVDDTDRHKPDPAPILLALDGLEARPSEAAYVGDAPVDVQAARAAGCAAIAVTWGVGSQERLRAEGPDALATSAIELERILLP